MRIVLHPLVNDDFNEALDYYERESSRAALKFDQEVRDMVESIASRPTHFSFYLGHHIFRRAKLPSFPYLIIYRVIPDGIRVTVLKHERRHPRFGMGRW